MSRFVEGIDRGQTTLFPECLEDWTPGPIGLFLIHSCRPRGAPLPQFQRRPVIQRSR
jgi:hypothetical protein